MNSSSLQRSLLDTDEDFSSTSTSAPSSSASRSWLVNQENGFMAHSYFSRTYLRAFVVWGTIFGLFVTAMAVVSIQSHETVFLSPSYYASIGMPFLLLANVVFCVVLAAVPRYRQYWPSCVYFVIFEQIVNSVFIIWKAAQGADFFVFRFFNASATISNFTIMPTCSGDIVDGYFNGSGGCSGASFANTTYLFFGEGMYDGLSFLITVGIQWAFPCLVLALALPFRFYIWTLPLPAVTILYSAVTLFTTDSIINLNHQLLSGAQCLPDWKPAFVQCFIQYFALIVLVYTVVPYMVMVIELRNRSFYHWKSQLQLKNSQLLKQVDPFSEQHLKDWLRQRQEHTQRPLLTERPESDELPSDPAATARATTSGTLDDTESDGDQNSEASENDLEKWEIDSRDLKLVARVAAGSSGVVWQAYLRTRKVAAKQIYAQMMHGSLTELSSEVKILASIQHQHVLAFLGLCHYYDLKSEMSSVVLVTEWCPSTLRHWIKDHARNSTQLQSVAPRLVEEVASGMDHLHRRCGIVHRDLKPGNVLLTGEGTVKICDFGVSVMKTPDGCVGVNGTPGYMAPEMFADTTVQIRIQKSMEAGIALSSSSSSRAQSIGSEGGASLDSVNGDAKYTEKVDIYAYGIMLWEIFSGGSRPFHKQLDEVDGNWWAIFAAIDSDNLRPNLDELKPECPPAIRLLIVQTWHRNANLRPTFESIKQTISDFRRSASVADDLGSEPQSGTSGRPLNRAALRNRSYSQRVRDDIEPPQGDALSHASNRFRSLSAGRKSRGDRHSLGRASPRSAVDQNPTDLHFSGGDAAYRLQTPTTQLILPTPSDASSVAKEGVVQFVKCALYTRFWAGRGVMFPEPAYELEFLHWHYTPPVYFKTVRIIMLVAFCGFGAQFLSWNGLFSNSTQSAKEATSFGKLQDFLNQGRFNNTAISDTFMASYWFSMSTIAIFGLATFIPVARRHWTMIRFVAIFEQLLRGVAYMLQLSNLSLEKIFELIENSTYTINHHNFSLIAHPGASFRNGTLVQRNYSYPACGGQIDPVTSSSAAPMSGPVSYCDTISFVFSIGAFSGIEMGVVALMWLTAYPVMMLVLALPFRHYIECLVIPFCLLVVELVVLLTPYAANDPSNYWPSDCSGQVNVTSRTSETAELWLIAVILVISFYGVIPFKIYISESQGRLLYHIQGMLQTENTLLDVQMQTMATPLSVKSAPTGNAGAVACLALGSNEVVQQQHKFGSNPSINSIGNTSNSFRSSNGNTPRTGSATSVLSKDRKSSRALNGCDLNGDMLQLVSKVAWGRSGAIWRAVYDSKLVLAKQYYTPLLGEKAIQYIFSMAKRRFKYSHANIVDFYGLCSFIDSQHRMASIVLTSEWCPVTLQEWSNEFWSATMRDKDRNLKGSPVSAADSQCINLGPLSITKHRDPVEQVLRVATQMLEGLGYIHTVIVSSHRDLKPTNVVVASDGVVKIADYGFTSLSIRSAAKGVSVRESLISPYTAPERLRPRDRSPPRPNALGRVVTNNSTGTIAAESPHGQSSMWSSRAYRTTRDVKADNEQSRDAYAVAVILWKLFFSCGTEPYHEELTEGQSNWVVLNRVAFDGLRPRFPPTKLLSWNAYVEPLKQLIEQSWVDEPQSRLRIPEISSKLRGVAAVHTKKKQAELEWIAGADSSEV